MVGVGGYVIAGLLAVLGLRLLALASQTRKLPELWIGLFFVTSGPGGILVLSAFEQANAAEALWRVNIGLPLLAAGTVATYLFNYSVFRPGQRWALALAVVGSLLVTWGCIAQLQAFAWPLRENSPRPEFVLARATCFVWATIEAARFHRKLERRLQLGLADPVLVNRFLLFALWSAAMATLPVISTLLLSSEDIDPMLRVFRVLPRIIGACMFVAIALCFFPPQAYLAWLRKRAAQAEAP